MIKRITAWAIGDFGQLAPVADLIARLYIAYIFFRSGLSKIQDWETTLYLFREEYHVPLLPAELAAVMGTAGELIFPVLLVVGLATRFSALALFALNIVAFASYYHALIETPAAWRDHLEWGIIIALIMTATLRSGGLTLDRLLRKKLTA